MSRALRPALRPLLERAFPGARVEVVPGDASTRAFFRLRLPAGQSRILMDYGKPFTGDTDDIRLARLFRSAGLPVARVLDAWPEAGCLILEDLGELTLERALLQLDSRDPAAGRLRQTLYTQAVTLAAALATQGTAALARSPCAGGPALDAARLRFEMDFFLRHWAGDLHGRRPPDSVRGVLYALADAAARTPKRVLCHRDLHARNLILRPDGSLAMVDIQDARWGPDTYDIASLLRDAYVELEEGEVELFFSLYLERLGQAADAAIRERFAVVGTQRMIKALGTFGYQMAVLGRLRYADAAVRTVRRLRALGAGPPVAQEAVRALAAVGLLEEPAGGG